MLAEQIAGKGRISELEDFSGKIDWQRIKVVIFDVDGTLYSQSILRKKMLFCLLKHYSQRPWKWKDLLILHHFRAERERKAGTTIPNLEGAQYEWCAAKGDFSLPRIKAVVDYWMFRYPNKYLLDCLYPGVQAFMDTLRQRGLLIGIYSDYKAEDKLRAMGLSADIVVCSTDKEVDHLKPHPQGLVFITQKLGVLPEECLFIGDRQELDGECALNAHMPFVLVEKNPFKQFDFYYKLQQELAHH
ncbi:HAD family hydrolase [Rufibacter glacialis]|uniref:phosphoglycolate phosphatase n=1 Tax=Rufibacter glacialis TaxID=1259555 RepID=A0A5M8QS01_9BACT|nr:HAD family hydrolase [Rufibacter glacialis]KAA6437754.1 HAD family hydrolase [Rufibacter glacialis]GGK56570.1 hypothetical protein GCM10011405_00880 [Rufibacter glacialis]